MRPALQQAAVNAWGEAAGYLDEMRRLQGIASENDGSYAAWQDAYQSFLRAHERAVHAQYLADQDMHYYNVWHADD